MLGSGAQAVTQEWTPTRPLRYIISFPPGGTSDLLARAMAPGMGEGLGQPLVLDNRGGAGGIVAMEALARAPRDGYTFGIASLSSHAANATLAAKLPYDPVRDFDPLTLLARSPLLLVVPSANTATSLKDFLAQAKARSRPVNFASPGVGLAAHIASELLKIQAQADMVHVPYKGGGPALADVVAGHVDMMFIPISSAMPLVQSGRLRALTIVRKERSPRLPNVPTIAESGFTNFDIAEWWGLLAPAGTLPAATRRLRSEAIRALQRPDVAERLSAAGVEVITSSPQELREYIVAEIKTYREIIQRANIKN
jgi:tripartite-type tricarboxylate transporter receptor subunit TctC